MEKKILFVLLILLVLLAILFAVGTKESKAAAEVVTVEWWTVNSEEYTEQVQRMSPSSGVPTGSPMLSI